MMTRPGAGVVTIIHDPDDDPEITRAALAAHDPRRGQIVVHPTVGTNSAAMLAADILTALGCHIDEDTDRAQHLGTPEARFAAVAAWLAADGIDLVVVVRAHRLTQASLRWLAVLAHAAQLRIVAIWHDRRPPDWAQAFGSPGGIFRETCDLDAALAGAQMRPTLPPTLSADGLPALAAMPVSGLARFRAEAHQTLTPPQFAAVDLHYRYGLQRACVWLTTQGRCQPILEALGADRSQAAPNVTTSSRSATACLGRARGRQPRVPAPRPDQVGLQAFLTLLSGSSLTPSATVARLRGAQAGLLLHGVLLQVPAELARACGPGLTGPCVTEQLAGTIRQRLAHPRLAAALAIAAIAGRPAASITQRPIPLPPGHHGNLIEIATGGSRAVYSVPGPAQPLIDAAAHYCRLRPRDEPHLLAGVSAAQVQRAAEAVGVVLPSSTDCDHRDPWHAMSAAWIVGDPVHRTGTTTPRAQAKVAAQ
jgi:hypothetical protein